MKYWRRYSSLWREILGNPFSPDLFHIKLSCLYMGEMSSWVAADAGIGNKHAIGPSNTRMIRIKIMKIISSSHSLQVELKTDSRNGFRNPTLKRRRLKKCDHLFLKHTRASARFFVALFLLRPYIATRGKSRNIQENRKI